MNITGSFTRIGFLYHNLTPPKHLCSIILLSMLTHLIQGSTLGFSAGVTPGPMQAYFLSQTLRNGWKRTLPAAFAPLITDGPIIILVLLVLTKIPSELLSGLQVLGGIFLLYLSWGAFRIFRTEPRLIQPQQGSAYASLRGAIVMNLLNPNPYIFWGTTLGPILIDGWRQSPAVGVMFIVGFYATMIVISIGFILVSAFARHLGSQITRLSSGVSAVALCAFGGYQIWSGLFR